jgi:predicted membrane protein (TIGR00267 family)
MAIESRIEKARKAYMAGDKTLLEKTHNSSLIAKSVGHPEGHKNNFSLPEIILGGQDGLVNVLGIILGMAAATAEAKIIVVAGLAAAFAESVSMAAVAYTSKIAEAEYYLSEYEREKWEIEHYPGGEEEEIRALYRTYGFEGKLLEDVVSQLTKDKEMWLEIMMNQELKLEPVDRRQAIPDAVVVGGSALIGSFIPLTPFFFLPVGTATIVSLIVSALTLFAVGYYKAKTTLGRSFIKQGLEMMVIGMVSALVGFVIGSFFKV